VVTLLHGWVAEFCITLIKRDRTNAIGFAENLRKNIEVSMPEGILVTASIGLATVSKDMLAVRGHQIMDDGKKLGGPQSASFVNAGKRLNEYWVYRLNLDSPGFVLHRGGFYSDVKK